jgi:hypothetical protein
MEFNSAFKGLIYIVHLVGYFHGWLLWLSLVFPSPIRSSDLPWNSLTKILFLIPTLILHLLALMSTEIRCGSATARMLRLWVRIPPGPWMSVCFDCCVLSGRGLGDELIPRPEESYRLWCVIVCYLESSWMGRPWPTGMLSPPPPPKAIESTFLKWQWRFFAYLKCSWFLAFN